MKYAIGKLTARTPAGDVDTLEVVQDLVTKELTLVIHEFWGMDGERNSLTTTKHLPATTTAKQLVIELKVIIASENYWFKKYGRASKHFVWQVEGDVNLFGLKQAYVEAALKGEMPVDDD